MRILHLSSLYPPHVVGGAERVVEMLAEAQARDGHTVGVLYFAPGPEFPGERHGVRTFPVANPNLYWVDELPFKSSPMRIANKLMTLINVRSSHEIAKVVGEWKPNIIHSHSMVFFPPSVWKSAKTDGASLIHTLHDYDLLCSRATLFSNGRNCGEQRRAICDLSSRWKKRFVGYVDEVVGVSEAVLNEHVRRGSLDAIPPAHRHVVWNGTRIAHQVRSLVRPKDGVFTFGFIGRLVPEKGIATLIAACRKLPASGWRLRVAGVNQGPNDLIATAEGLPIEFIGFVDPKSFFETVDVLAVPSIWREPFGLTVVEAFACGVPVIGAASGAIPELVGKHGPGPDWIVPPDDVDALATVMRRVLDNGRSSLPESDAFTEVVNLASPELMAEGYARVYDFALSSNEPRAK